MRHFLGSRQETSSHDSSDGAARYRRPAGLLLIALGVATPVSIGIVWASGHDNVPMVIDCSTDVIPGGGTTSETIMGLMPEIDGKQAPEAAHRLASWVGEFGQGTVIEVCGAETLGIVAAAAYDETGSRLSSPIPPTVTFGGQATMQRLPGDPFS